MLCPRIRFGDRILQSTISPVDRFELRSRRDFLRASLAVVVAPSLRFASVAAQDSVPGGRLLGTIPFSASDAPPLNRLLGAGLDARLFTGLSPVERDHPTTPNDRF